MLLFGTLFLRATFKALFKKKTFSFYFNNDICLKQTFWKLKTFCVYFENKPEQLGAFKRDMHEQMCVDVHFNTSYQQALSPVRSVVNGKNEKTE